MKSYVLVQLDTGVPDGGVAEHEAHQKLTSFALRGIRSGLRMSPIRGLKFQTVLITEKTVKDVLPFIFETGGDSEEEVGATPS